MARFRNTGSVWVTGAVLVAAAVVPLPEAAQSSPLDWQQGTASVSESKKQRANGRIPAAVVGSWTWGTVNPGRYVSKTTGEYLGHSGGGAVSYLFSADGTFKRYVLIDSGAGFSNESIFSAMEGKATFNESAGTFTLRFIKGTISFEKTSGITRRPLTREDMERGGTVFTYRLEKDKEGNASLIINDPGKETKEERTFRKDKQAEDAPAKEAQTPKP